MKRREEFLALLEHRLSTERFLHTLGVEQQAVYLANAWGVDEKKAALAGLLHDICKEMPIEEQLQYLKQHGILVDNYKHTFPEFWHGLTAAVYLEHELGIHDKEVLEAIEHHVVGRFPLQPLDEVLFVADFTEPGREYAVCGKVRENLPYPKEQALFSIMEYSIQRAVESQSHLFLSTVQNYNFYREALEKQQNR